jgi:hypothetical protein
MPAILTRSASSLPVLFRAYATCGLGDHRADPLMTSALARLFTNIEPAINKLETLMAGTGGGSAVRRAESRLAQ